MAHEVLRQHAHSRLIEERVADGAYAPEEDRVREVEREAPAARVPEVTIERQVRRGVEQYVPRRVPRMTQREALQTAAPSRRRRSSPRVAA